MPTALSLQTHKSYSHLSCVTPPLIHPSFHPSHPKKQDTHKPQISTQIPQIINTEIDGLYGPALQNLAALTVAQGRFKLALGAFCAGMFFFRFVCV
jgi:hypothetical protein